MELIRKFPDTEILANIRNGEKIEETIKAVYRDHFGSLSWYVLNNSGSRQDAEDIFQEVVVSFIDIVQKDKFRGESGIKTFLFSLNRHCWLNELKRRGRALAREEKFEKGQEKTEWDVSHHIAGREEKAALLRMLEELGEACRKILLLFYYENRSMREILAATDYENEQVVRNKKYKCLKQLELRLRSSPAIMEFIKNSLHG